MGDSFAPATFNARETSERALIFTAPSVGDCPVFLFLLLFPFLKSKFKNYYNNNYGTINI
jgi:hypothetical protein